MNGFNVGSVIAHIKADISNFQNGLSQAEKSVSSFQGGLTKFNSSIAGFMTAAGVGVTAVVGGLVVAGKKAIEMAGNFEQSEIAFTTLLKDRGKALAAIKDIEKDAKQTPYNLPDLIKANQLLISAGRSTSQARDEIKNLGNAIAATGGGTAELNRLAVNMQQIQAVGKASALDIKQFAFAGINIYALLADSTGKTVEQVKEMDITYDVLAESLAKASAAGGMFEGAMEAQSKSLQGVFSNIQDVIGITLKDIAVQTGLFDAVKNGARSFLGFIESKKDSVIRFLTVMGNVLRQIIGMFTGNWDASEMDEALTFFTGDDWEKAEQIRGIITKFVDALKAVGTWIVENKEAVLAFLKGLAIALGALLIIGTITALIAALTNPVVLVVAAIGLLSVAWSKNLGGIQEKTKSVFEWLKNAFNEVKKFWDTWGGTITAYFKYVWTVISETFKFAIDLIVGIVKFFIAVFKGDWKGAWDAVKGIVTSGWNAVKAIFASFANVVSESMSAVYKVFTEKFEALWGKAKEIAGKIRDAIRDAFDKDERDSPSIMDTVGTMVKSASRALTGVTVPNYKHDIMAGLNTARPAYVGASAGTSIYIDMGGAFISDELGARRMAEIVGDDIVKKLRQNIRF